MSGHRLVAAPHSHPIGGHDMQEEPSILASLGIDPAATSPEPPAGVWETALQAAFDPDAVADPDTVPDMDDTLPPDDDDDIVVVDDHPHADDHDTAHPGATDHAATDHSLTGHGADADDPALDHPDLGGGEHHDLGHDDIDHGDHHDHGHDGHHDI
ncbi:hypothetical protein [Gordonia sp. DT101]|uniref:hypothetical protein n=1 Tax=Gordonia sp. DT101 TaxID=3416545 RepID=UPI003CEDDD04